MWGGFFHRKVLRNALAGSGIACYAQSLIVPLGLIARPSTASLSLFFGVSVTNYMETKEIGLPESFAVPFILNATAVALSIVLSPYFGKDIDTAVSLSGRLVGSTCLLLSMISHVCRNEVESVVVPPAPKRVEPRIERIDVSPWEKGIKMCC